MKYSNKIVMYAIAAGYLVLIMVAFLWNLDIMYLLAPYVVVTLFCIDYTNKRSNQFIRYYLAFDLAINAKGHAFKFVIIAQRLHKLNQPILHDRFEVVKVYQYQTPYIFDMNRLQDMMDKLRYFIDLSDGEMQIVRRLTDEGSVDIDKWYFSYGQILSVYHQFKDEISQYIKDNASSLIDSQIVQPPKYHTRKRISLTSFLRSQ